MRLKTISKTVFHDLTRSYAMPDKITVKEFIKRLNYFFNGENIEEVISVGHEMKISLIHFKIKTASGIYKAQANLGHSYNNKIGMDWNKPLYGYETIENFVHDFKMSTDDDFRILKNYQNQLAKKEKKMEEASLVIHNVSMKHPEYFL